MRDTSSRPRDAATWTGTASSRAQAGWPDVVWVVLWLLTLAAIVIFGRWGVVPFYLIWLGFALLCGVRISGIVPTLWVLAAMAATALAGVALEVSGQTRPTEELAAVALLTAVFLVMMWHVHRRQADDAERARVSDNNGRLLETQRRFLQDASHQLRTPITIALGHAELLARELADGAEQRDIHVVVGELTRLKALSERLLVIAASEEPEFLRPEPVDLDSFVIESLRRWLPAAKRAWKLGQLDPVTVHADRERLGLAVDALLENAVQHTRAGDRIRLSVLRDNAAGVRLVVEDTGEGIAPAEREHVFERFRTGTKGTGLGLALVRAVAVGHGGDVAVHSVPGSGSRFEVLLPAVMHAGAELRLP